MAVYGMVNDMKKEAELLILKSKIKAPGESVDPKAIDEATWLAEWKKVQARKKTNLINLIKNLGDATTASQVLGYPKKFLGFDFSDTVVGIGGFTSAFLTCYQTYP